MAPPRGEAPPSARDNERKSDDRDRGRDRDDGRRRPPNGDVRDDRKRKHQDTRDHDSTKRRRTQSGSPDRNDRGRDRDRHDERNHDQKGREPPTGPRARPTGPRSNHARGPKAINRADEMDIDPSEASRANARSGKRPKTGPLSAPFIPDIAVAEDDELLLEVKNVMGFAGFKSTNNRQVPGNKNNFAVRKEKQTQYRQYMNRAGGFNRPLSPSRQ